MFTRREFITAAGVASGVALSSCAASRMALVDSRGDIDWEAVRRQTLLPPDTAYLNTGTLGACPRPVVEAVADHLRAYETHLAEYDYSTDSEPPLTGYDPFTARRQKVADFIHADVGEIALTQNATMAMNFIANGLPLDPGDEVVTTDQEHPGGICPWQLQAARRGIVVKQIPVAPPIEPAEVVRRFQAAITPKTRVLMASHITSARGLVLPARELCALARERGVVAVIDGAQVVGHLHVNVSEIGCDFYVSSPHKWLLAPKGCGFLYVRREMLDRVTTTLASSEWNNKKWDAARLQQYGTGSVTQLVGLGAAIDFHNQLGRDPVEARVRRQTQRLRAGLSAMPHVQLSSATHPQMVAGVTTFRVNGKKGIEVQNALWARKIRVRAVGDLGVRAGTHIYVLDRDIDHLLEVVAGLG